MSMSAILNVHYSKELILRLSAILMAQYSEGLLFQKCIIAYSRLHVYDGCVSYAISSFYNCEPFDSFITPWCIKSVICVI